VTPFTLSLIVVLIAYMIGLLLALLINIHIRFSLGTLLIALTLGACAMGLIVWMVRDPNRAREEAQVLKVARAEVAENGNWLSHAEFERPFKHADGTWSVTVWRLPATPGGFTTVDIDETGEVTGYRGGE
jgi:hypothetical protein